jgi:hypothetical protein
MFNKPVEFALTSCGFALALSGICFSPISGCPGDRAAGFGKEA